jgi:hypothetical protein
MAESVDFGPQVATVNQRMSSLNRSTHRPLTKFEQREIAAGGKIYIYNISSTYYFEKTHPQLGNVRINPRKEGSPVSDPYVIPGTVMRRYDKGFGRKEPFLEDGMEVAMDVCGCHPEYPPEGATNNLTNFGVIIVRKPWEDLSKTEAARLLADAQEKLLTRLRLTILEADNWSQGIPAQLYKSLIGPVHHKALAEYNQITNSKEERPWSTVRKTAASLDCQWCGSPVKPSVPLCPNCHRVVNEKLFKELGGKEEK